jgi:tetratricopeptide (TPR) repeat protein
MKNRLIEEVRILTNSGKSKNMEQAQNLLMDYLKIHPQDTEMWLLLTRTECNPPLYDHERIIHYAQHILSYDPFNPYALLFWAYANRYLTGMQSEELYNKLCKVRNDDPQIMGMIEIAKSWYLYDTDTEKCEAALKKSIEYCPNFEMNFRDLGELYKEQGRLEEANFLIEHASQISKRALKALSGRESSDDISLNDFFGEFFAGIYTIDVYDETSDNIAESSN